MATQYRRARSYAKKQLRQQRGKNWADHLQPSEAPAPLRIPKGNHVEGLEDRWKLLRPRRPAREELADPATLGQVETYRHNIENLIGTVKVPVGLAGPLRVNGLSAHGDYYVPLATTEAALVASYSRGCQLITEAGGCAAMVLAEGVSRAPGFAFRNLIEVGNFVTWVMSQFKQFQQLAKTTTRHGELVDMKLTVEGNHVYLSLDYSTGDAAGQNMVTIATQSICDYIKERSPVAAQYAFVEGNFSGDKKATSHSFLTVRGKKATAEVVLPSALVERILRTTPKQLTNYWRISGIGGVLSGTLGINGHYANGLAAIFIACGQDVACVAESAVGMTRFELTEAGDLYACVTLPNLIVGTVGGGTGLPSQRACLEILGLAGNRKAAAFAEVCAALCLAGELSIGGALCAGDFARAHKLLARGRKREQT